MVRNLPCSELVERAKRGGKGGGLQIHSSGRKEESGLVNRSKFGVDFCGGKLEGKERAAVVMVGSKKGKLLGRGRRAG